MCHNVCNVSHSGNSVGDGVEAAVTAGQLGHSKPRGRMIGGRGKSFGDEEGAEVAIGAQVEDLANLDPRNHPNGLRNEDMEKLRDRFSGWV